MNLIKPGILFYKGIYIIPGSLNHNKKNKLREIISIDKNEIK